MYAFAQRSDTVVHDEPLYASYLALTGYDRPYKDMVLAAQSTDGNAVMESLQRSAGEKTVYIKHMAKFVHGIQRRWLKSGLHIVCFLCDMASKFFVCWSS